MGEDRILPPNITGGDEVSSKRLSYNDMSSTINKNGQKTTPDKADNERSPSINKNHEEQILQCSTHFDNPETSRETCAKFFIFNNNDSVILFMENTLQGSR